MMRRKFALLLDGGFVRKRLGANARSKRARQPVRARDVVAFCDRLCASEELTAMELLRIYFYDAAPSEATRKHPQTGQDIDFGKTGTYKESKELLDGLARSANVALRLGTLSLQGWKIRPKTHKKVLAGGKLVPPKDVVPNFKQKGVDLRIGLDIAKLSLQRLVDVIVLVTGDSDLIPAMRFARREGCRTYLCTMGQPHRDEMLADADRVVTVPLPPYGDVVSRPGVA